MKKFCLVFALLFVCTVVLVNFASNANGKNVEDTTEDVQNIETKNYAIYPSHIIENNPIDTNKYVHYKRNIDIRFPQIYFSNEYSRYNMDLETQINKLLFALSIGNDDGFLIGRDIRDIKEYCSDYTITKSDDDFFSIKYYGHLYSISHARVFAYGITIDTKTGETRNISDFFSINEDLIKKLEKGEIKYHSAPMYDKSFVVETVLDFIESYNILPNKNNLFFISENCINLIIPVNQGNSNYIILEIQS